MKKTIKQRNLELLQANGWKEDNTTRVSRYMVLSKPGVGHHYYLGKMGAVRRGKTVTASVSVKLKAPVGASRLEQKLGELADEAHRCKVTPEEHDRQHALILGREAMLRDCPNRKLGNDHAHEFLDGYCRFCNRDAEGIYYKSLVEDDSANRTPDADLAASERDDQPEEVERNRMLAAKEVQAMFDAKDRAAEMCG